MDDLVSHGKVGAGGTLNLFPDRVPAIKHVLAATVKRMKEAKHHPNTVGLQFVQIGDDRKARNALRKIYGENSVRFGLLPLLVQYTDARKLNLAHG
jgi:hypothetical protein